MVIRYSSLVAAWQPHTLRGTDSPRPQSRPTDVKFEDKRAFDLPLKKYRATMELHEFSWKRMIEAVEIVREQAQRATTALHNAGIPSAIAGDNAVGYWVASVDRAAVRNSQDIEILICRSDFELAKSALEAVGFSHDNLMEGSHFIDGPDGSPRDAVHLLFAGEKVRDTYPVPSADVTEAVAAEEYQVLALAALVRMKLNSFRRKDQVHLLDLLDVGLIDSSWLLTLVPEHATRLQQLIDDPDG